MDQAIPTGPQMLAEPADQILQQARADAYKALNAPTASPYKAAKAAIPAQNNSAPPGDNGPPPPPPQTRQLSAPEQRPGNEPDVNAVEPTQLAPAIPPKDAVTPPLATESYGDVLKEHLKTDAGAVGNGLMRGFTAMGKFVGLGAAGAASLSDMVTGRRDADKVFDFIKNYVTPAYDNWKGPDTSGNPVASVASGVAEFAPQMLTGGAMIVASPAIAGTERAVTEIDKGHTVRTAAALGTIAAITNALFLKIPLKDPNIGKRILKAVLGGEAVNRGSEVTQKALGQLIGDKDWQDAVKDIDPADLNKATVDGLLQTAFAILHGKGHSDGPKPEPTPDATPPPPAGSDGGEPPPPPPPSPPPEAVAPAQVAAKPLTSASLKKGAGAATPVPEQKLPDLPTAEPPKDLLAQFADAADTKTKRQGVFLSSANLESLKTDGTSDGAQVRDLVKSAQASGRLTKTPGGFLVMPDRDSALKAKNELASGSDPQAVIGRITGAGEGKTADQTAVVQGQTPEGAVATESMVKPEEIPAKVAEVKSEGKTPVVTTPEAAQERRAMGIAQVGKSEVAVQIEPGAPEGMVRVRPLDESGEPGKLTHDIPSGKVRNAESPPPNKGEQGPATSKPPAERPPSEAEPKPAVTEAPTSGAEPPLATALAEHQSQEEIPPGKSFAAPLAERQDNASSFAGALLAEAKNAEGKAPEAVIERANKAGKAALNLTSKSAEATAKGRGTGHARITAINEEMHKAARQLLGRTEKGDEVPAVAPKAAALKARVEKAKAVAEAERGEPVPPKAKPKSAAMQAREEVLAGGKEENALTTRLIKKRTVEIEQAAEKAKAAAKAEMVEAPVNKEPEPKSAEPAEVEAPKVRAAEKPPTVSEKLKRKQAENEHSRLMDDYQHANDEEAPELFDRIVASASKLAGRAMTPEEIATAHRGLENNREVTKLTEEQAADNEPNRVMSTTEEAMRSKNPLSRALATLHNNLIGGGLYRKLADVQASGETISSHEVIRDMIKAAPNPMLRGMLQRLLVHSPDIPIRPTKTVYDPQTRTTNAKWGGMFVAEHNYIQSKLDPSRPFTTESLIHEIAHSATAYELRANPDGALATELKAVREDVINRLRKQYGSTIDEHLSYFAGKGPAPRISVRDFYGLKDIKEFVAEAFINPDFQRMLIGLDRGGLPGNAPTSLLGRIANIIAKWLGVEHATPLFERVMDLTHQVMETQKANFPIKMAGTHAEFARVLPFSIREAMLKDALDTEVPPPRVEAPRDPYLAAASPADLESLATLDTDDNDIPPLRGVDEALKNSVGSEATALIRRFVYGAKKGVIGAVRNIKPAFTSYAQMMARRMSDFGHVDDPNNPLRKLQDADDGRNTISTEMLHRAKPIVEDRLRLGKDVSDKLGQLQIDSTVWGIDPSKEAMDQPALARASPKFAERYAEFQARWNNTPDAAKRVYTAERDYLQWAARKAHRAGVDTALLSYDQKNITPAQRALLYNVRDPDVYDDLIGPGKLIDVGDSNAPLTGALKSMAGLTQMKSIYFPLARHGDFVVQVRPEGDKAFGSEAEAKAFSERVKGLSPGSKAKVIAQGDGKFNVSYKAEYTSMHEDTKTAEADAARMRALGFDVGHVTQKTFGQASAPLTVGLKDLVSEATRQINKGVAEGDDVEGARALVDTLRSSFLQMIAARSSYAGSKLARKGVGGVKGSEMGLNFAQHAQSNAWHTSALASVFKQAEALAEVRAAARDQFAGVDQKTMYRRGRTVEEIGKRMKQEVTDYGGASPGSALVAKLGFLNYLASPAQAVINATQNFQVAIPRATARFGYGKATAAFGRAMKATVGPAMGNPLELMNNPNKLIDIVRKMPQYGKWARGENSPIQQLVDKGVISGTFANRLGDAARTGSTFWPRVFEYVRVANNVAETFNRISTALAVLDITNGNVRTTADFIRETHMDYSAGNQPRAFKIIRKAPILGDSIVMFKTYAQGMTHLLYSSIRDTIMGAHNAEGSFAARRAEAAKTVAGLVLASAIFTGVKGATPEIVHLAMYAYNKAFGDKDHYYNLDATMHRLLAEEFGKKAGDVMFAGIPTLAGIDVSNRMGLNTLVFNNPPDILSADKSAFRDFLFSQMGTIPSLAASDISGSIQHLHQGDLGEAISSLVPSKLYQDSVKAFDQYTGGNIMVEPGNKWAAGMQAFGFKPSGLAQAQERAGDAVDYAKFAKERRNELLKQFTEPGGKGIDSTALNNFNRANPGKALTVGEIIKYKRFVQQSTNEAKGGLSRDPTLNKIRNY